MKRPPRLAWIAAVAAVVVLALSAWMESWGGPVLVAGGAIGWFWYRTQVARGEAAGHFFEAGEDTRLTSFQGGSPSEMPVDRDPPPPAP